jgi:hypothetical protein
MKKLLVVVILLLPFVASASYVQCNAPGPLPTLYSWTTISGVGWSCEAGDLIFSNFHVVNLSMDPDVYVSFSNPVSALSWASTVDFHDVDAFAHSFTIAYTVTIDPAHPGMPAPPAGLGWAVVTSSTGLQDNGGGPTNTFTAVLSAGGSGTTTTTYSSSTGQTSNTPDITTEAQTFTVTDTFTTPGQSKVFDVSNSFTQAEVPEPSTMLLLGGACIGLGVIGRKRRKSV